MLGGSLPSPGSEAYSAGPWSTREGLQGYNLEFRFCKFGAGDVVFQNHFGRRGRYCAKLDHKFVKTPVIRCTMSVQCELIDVESP